MAPQPSLEVVALRALEVQYGPAKAVPCSKEVSERVKSRNGAAHGLKKVVQKFQQLDRKNERRRFGGSRASVRLQYLVKHFRAGLVYRNKNPWVCV